MSDSLKQISALAALLREGHAAVESATEKLSTLKAEVRKLEEEDLPELMRELGLSEIKLEDGSSVKVVDEVDCHISIERRAAAHAWLTDNGFGGLIKSALTVEFGRNEHEEALAAAAKIQDLLGRGSTFNESVHASTLKAFIKEQMAAGVTIPTEMFGIRPYAKAKLTKPKAK